MQRAVSEALENELERIRGRLEYGEGGASAVEPALRALYDGDFVPTSRQVNAVADEQYSLPSWAEIQPLLHEAVRTIGVRRINGEAEDVLGYRDYKQGLNVIAVGGDKLSRGLTLEGLSVSYYLRSSRMYDTLMQMGRWFGYRPGYLDVCRLYTTAELVSWYKHITLADQELRAELDHMARVGKTPAEFGLRVRTHPEALIITSANKMRSGETMRLSYAGTISETIAFDTHPGIVSQNFRNVDAFLLEAPGKRLGKRDAAVWEGVPGASVAAMLDGFRTHADSQKARSELLARYIRLQLEHGELEEWTVAMLTSGRGPKWPAPLGGHMFAVSIRSDLSTEERDTYRIRRLVSPPDEALDLSDDEELQALEQTQKHWMESEGKGEGETEGRPGKPAGPFIRDVRPARRGLMLVYPLDPSEKNKAGQRLEWPFIGLALSFPTSDLARTVEYRVNNVYWEQEFEGA